ncbi:hypothetical protein Bca101_038145 [Brassica carinata]
MSEVLLYGMAVLLTVSLRLSLRFRRRESKKGDSAGGGPKVRRRNERGSWTHRRREVSLTGFLTIGVHRSLELTLFSFLSLEL